MYTMRYGNDKVALSEVESEKDLAIMFGSEMKFQAHINDVCNRGYQRIAVIRRTFTYMDKDMFLLLDSNSASPGIWEYCLECLLQKRRAKVRKGSEKSHKNGTSY